MSRTVALTGATGFIGTVLRDRLVRAGVRVRALSRQHQRPMAGVEWVVGTLEDRTVLAALTAGADSVIHCAGAVRGSRKEDFQRTNVEGSLRMTEAARLSGRCERFLLISSLAARHPQLSWYAMSKREAETQVMQAAGDIAVTIFRPTAVYGPGDRDVRPLLEWLLRGWLFPLGRSSARLSFLHVDDLAEAAVCWLEAAPAPTGTYELDDCHLGGYNWRAIAAMAARARNGPVRCVAVPVGLLKAIARINMSLARIGRYSPMLTLSKIGELAHPDWSCDSQPAQDALGWQPQTTLNKALEERLF